MHEPDLDCSFQQLSLVTPWLSWWPPLSLLQATPALTLDYRSKLMGLSCLPYSTPQRQDLILLPFDAQLLDYG